MRILTKCYSKNKKSLEKDFEEYQEHKKAITKKAKKDLDKILGITGAAYGGAIGLGTGSGKASRILTGIGIGGLTGVASSKLLGNYGERKNLKQIDKLREEFRKASPEQKKRILQAEANNKLAMGYYSKIEDEEFYDRRRKEREEADTYPAMGGITGGLAGVGVGSIAGRAVHNKAVIPVAIAGGALGGYGGYKLGKVLKKSEYNEIKKKLDKYNKASEKDRKYLREKERYEEELALRKAALEEQRRSSRAQEEMARNSRNWK